MNWNNKYFPLNDCIMITLEGSRKDKRGKMALESLRAILAGLLGERIQAEGLFTPQAQSIIPSDLLL